MPRLNVTGTRCRIAAVPLRETPIIESFHATSPGRVEPADIPTDRRESVRVLVVTNRQENAETINSILRNGGIPLHYRRANTAEAAADVMDLGFDLGIVFSDEDADLLGAVLAARNEVAREFPILSCRQTLDPDLLGADVIAGAADLITPSQRRRLFKVFERELRSARLGRALREAVGTAAAYKRQLKTFMAGSAEAIAHVQEGVILDTNPAWNQLFGFEDEKTPLGLPIMDLFDAESHASLKGALVACMQDRWPGDPLRCQGLDKDGQQLSLELNLELAQFENEPCVLVSILPAARDDSRLLKELREAINRDPVTGMFARHFLIDRLQEAIREPLKGGVRALAVIRPDGFDHVVESVGSIASEEVLADIASILSDHVQPSDVYGRFGGTMFAALLNRGTMGDVRAWSDGLCRKISGRLFEIADKSVSVTSSVGLTMIEEASEDLDEFLSQAMEACRAGRLDGGSGTFMSAVDKASSDIADSDRLWVPRIKQALIENRFRLAHQPIASLAGEEASFSDILVRMLDEQGEEILPNQFMPAAERNQLIKNIDRWVIGAAVHWSLGQNVARAFVRLSQSSVVDDTLVKWLLGQVAPTTLRPEQLVLQVPEIVADKHLKATRDLAENLRSLGFGFAIEHFGVGSRPAQVLNHVPMEYLKVDGSLMQGMAHDVHLQTKVSDLVAEARDKGIATIAERVEDANTMAVLWQIGVEYIQGYQIQEPEVILAEDPPHQT
jgi:diguanylate cyclase (GGDEF)-like protein